MTNISFLNQLTNRSNHVGIALFIAMATNDNEIDFEKLNSQNIAQIYSSPFSQDDSIKFKSIENNSLSLQSDMIDDEELILLRFANKIISNSTDLDLDVKKALQTGYWDLI